MARNFPFETPNTVPSSGAANGFHYAYKSTDNMHNLMANNLLVVGEYPVNLFWGGVSYEDVPQLYHGAIKYDYENGTITIDNLFDNSFEGVEFTPRQLSYAWVADTQRPYNSSLATGQLNWGINFGEDFNNTSYLNPNKAGNFANNQATYTYFADDIPVSKLGIAVNVLYINIIDWNNLTGSVNPGTCIQQTSLANFIGMRDNDPNYSNYRLVGFVSVGRQTLQEDGTIRLLAGNAFWYNTPMNLLMGNYINSPVSNIYQTDYRLNSASSGADRTILSYGTYIYRDGSYGFLADSKTGVLVNQYNGDQTFDISEFLNSGNEYKRLRYNNGDKYLLYYDFHRGGYWGLLQILPIYNSLDDLLKVIAGYGLFFTAAPLAYESINNDNIYVPVLDDDNIYHGQYTNGQKNLLNNYFEKGKNNESTYEPKNPEKKEEEEGKAPDENDTGMPISKLSNSTPPMTDFIHQAVLPLNTIQALATQLWNKPDSWWDKIATSINENPMNYFISLRYFPIKFRHDNASQKLTIGRGGGLELGVDYYSVLPTESFEFGTVDIKRQYNNFLDYLPYTNISIFLPFAGTFELNPTMIMGKTLSLTLEVDTTDGSGVWILYNTTKKQPVLIKQCRIAAEVPISGLNASQMSANIINATMQTAQHTLNYINSSSMNAAGSTNSALNTDVGGVLSSIAFQDNLDSNFALTALGDAYNIARSTKEIPQYIGSSTGAAACAANHTPYITYKRPICENPQNYGHTVGRLVNQTHMISSLTGYTVCRNVDVSGISKATSNERAQIKKIMESGFFA